MTTSTPAALSTDWPSIFVMHVRDEAVGYASALRGMWPDPSALRDAAVERLLQRIDADAYDVESEDSWMDRYEQGVLEAELAAALDHYASTIDDALHA
jgi:hypothetical protein